MQTLKVSDVTITSIIERDGPWRKPQDMFPAYDPAIGRQHLASLALSSALLQQAWRAVQPVGSSNDRGTAVAARHDGRNAPLPEVKQTEMAHNYSVLPSRSLKSSGSEVVRAGSLLVLLGPARSTRYPFTLETDTWP
jgi:hypothetical protein